MASRSVVAGSPKTARPSYRRRWRARRSRRGVSEVVATILLLSLTVTLFAAIFAFVTRFPPPPAQDVNQFETSVSQNSTGITGLQILQSGGPTVPGGDHVYLQSSRGASNWQFTQSSGIPVSWGIGNTSNGWSTGQYWTTAFKPALKIPTNITIYILSTTSLLFTTTVPGYSTNTPPIVTATYTVPSTPAVGAAFQIFAVISGNTSGLTANVSLGEIPGLSGTQSLAYNATAGAWGYSVPAGGTTTAGTYLAFVQGTDALGPIAGSVFVTIAGSGGGGGGGGTSTTYSATVAPVVQPPFAPTTTSAPSIYLEAVINYTGTLSNAPVWVNFTVSQVEGGRSSTTYLNSTLLGQTGDKITGPEVLTVYSQTPYATWLLNSTAKLTASVNVLGVGKLSPTDVLYTPNLVTGSVYVTTSSSGAKSGEETGFSHTCTTTGSGANCPYLYVNVSNSFTSASVAFSGTVWSNATGTCTGCTSTSYTISSTTVAASGTAGVNAAGSGNRWKPGGTLATGDKFTIAAGLTVTMGGTTVGYLYTTWVITLT